MRTHYASERDYALTILESSRSIPNHAYYGELPIGETWAFSGIVGRSRDSRLLEESNWQVVTSDLLERFPDQCEIVRESHWLVGWVESLAIHVQNDVGELQPIVYAAFEWYRKLDDYPIADEDHYSNMEYESMWESIVSEVKSAHLRKNAPSVEHIASKVWSWLDAHLPSAVENIDDNGYVDCDALLFALYRLNYLMVSEQYATRWERIKAEYSARER